MPCLVVVLAFLSPRLALVGMAIFSDVIGRAFDGWFIPLLGFFLLPWTTLAFAFFWNMGTNEVAGFEWFLVGLAFLIDIGAVGGGRRVQTSRSESY